MGNLKAKPPIGATVSRTKPRARGLSAFWLLNEAGAGRITDLVTAGYPGDALTGNPWAGGDDGSYLACDGSTKFATVPPRRLINDLGPMTVSLRIPVVPAGQCCWLYKSDNNVGAGWWVDYNTTRGGIGLVIVASANCRRYVALPAAGPFTFTAVWDGTMTATGITLYLNGQAAVAYSHTQNGTAPHNTDAAQSLTIGKGGTGIANAANAVDWVKLYSRMLRPEEVLADYVDPYGVMAAPPVRLSSSSSTTTGTLAATLDLLTLSAAGASTVTGTASPTLAALTLSAAGALAGTGSATATLAALTASSVGTSSVAGTASPTLSAVALAAAGTSAVTGSAAGTLAPLGLAASAASPVVGSSAATLAELTSASAAQAPAAGALGGSLDPIVLAAAGSSAVAGAAAPTLADSSLSAAGSSAVAGTLDAALGAATLAAAGGSQGSAAVNITLVDVTCSAAGESPVLAAASATLESLGLAAAGRLAGAGSLAAALAALTLSAAGTGPGGTAGRAFFFDRFVLARRRG